MSSLTPQPPLRQEHEGAALDGLRRKLGSATGTHYWRALEEWIETPEARHQLQQAWSLFPGLDVGLDRRGFLKLLGASLALAGLGACSRPPSEEIVPWVRQPSGMPLSLPQFFATCLLCGGDVAGALVETHAGRPTKIEGNPLHPASLGASSAMMQAAVLELWDPDRSRSVLHQQKRSSWDGFAAYWRQTAERFTHDGSGLRVLSGRIDSPTLARQRLQLLQRFPGSTWHQFEAIDHDSAFDGAQLAFGRFVRTRHHLGPAQVIVSLEADFLGSMAGHLRHARDFAERRKPGTNTFNMSRLYALEATPSLTGVNADHVWRLPSGSIAALAFELAAALGIDNMGTVEPGSIFADRIRALAADLLAHRGRSLVLAGPSQPAVVHAFVHRINQQLGNVGTTLDYFDAPEPRENNAQSMRSLVSAMGDGLVDTLLILDGNPAHATPADLQFGDLLDRVPHTIHAGLYADETALHCRWHLPLAHPLEQWSDLRAFDGTASIAQPVIEPLYAGRSAHQLLAMLAGDPLTDGRSIVRATWKAEAADDAAWQRCLREGVISAAPDAVHADASRVVATAGAARSDGDLELVFRPDATLWDGRYANNGWLQELPKPLTQLTWGDAALVSPALAAARGLKNGDVVGLQVDSRRIDAPIWIMPGQAEHSVTLSLGGGRECAGRVGSGVGTRGYLMRNSASPWRLPGLTIVPTGRHLELATTQRHHAMEGRAPVREATLAQFLANPGFAHEDETTLESLYPQRPLAAQSWGMSVDLNACIGCNACTIACQAENNIPVVGADQVRRGREMHWIRVDRYYSGAPEAPRTLHQPVPCMHCEHAPCEVVCPVGATVHDSEGLNLQVYNRCVGTRFCANNCPYKVRRFNFLQYADLQTPQRKAQRNPEVTVRNRGVMEKCTYCIQRIEVAHINADKDGRLIADGEVVTACQAACPTRAITFGNIADPASAVSIEKKSPRHYTLLQELNTRPRTTYLAALRNPNPAIGDDE